MLNYRRRMTAHPRPLYTANMSRAAGGHPSRNLEDAWDRPPGCAFWDGLALDQPTPSAGSELGPLSPSGLRARHSAPSATVEPERCSGCMFCSAVVRKAKWNGRGYVLSDDRREPRSGSLSRMRSSRYCRAAEIFPLTGRPARIVGIVIAQRIVAEQMSLKRRARLSAACRCCTPPP